MEFDLTQFELPPQQEKQENNEKQDDLLSKYLVQAHAYLAKSGGLRLSSQTR